MTVPWFGPNAWQAVLRPVPGGNIDANHSIIELKLTFKEGGATDFHSSFERIKERLQQAVEVAREAAVTSNHTGGYLSGVNMDAVHLDQLPSYEASGLDPVAPILQDDTNVDQASRAPGSLAAAAPPAQNNPGLTQPAPRRQAESTDSIPPNDAPPGYEETQQQTVQQELDRRLMQ